MTTVPKRKSNSNKILITLAILAVLGIGGGLWAKHAGWIGKADVVKVAIEKAEERKIIETVSASGKIYPVIEVGVSPDVSGEIMELTVEEGDSVKSGQLIARINPEIYASVVDQANAGVNASRSNEANASARIKQGDAAIKQLQVQIDNARRSLKRSQQLYKDEVISKAELETAETLVQQLEAQIQG